MQYPRVKLSSAIRLCGVMALCLSVVGCKRGPGGSADAPVGPFSLAWSEYPSWSVFGVAEANGLIDKEAGKKGTIEEKWGIDIVLKQMDYDPCLTAYASGAVDGVCITNMDVLAPSLSRPSVAVFPTSTSDGADACLVKSNLSLDDLAGIETHGLEKSVSQYVFERNLEIQGRDPKMYKFANADPAAAAQSMQQGQAESIVVWNPFMLQTLRSREGQVKVLFDSTTIPEEIIDMVVIGKDALNRKGGESFARALLETYYEVNEMMEGSKRETTLVQLGEKFSNLSAADMEIVVQQTKFYKNVNEAMTLLKKESFRREIMPRVVDFCASHGIVDQKPSIGFDDPSAQLNFSTKYLQQILDEQATAAAYAESAAAAAREAPGPSPAEGTRESPAGVE